MTRRRLQRTPLNRAIFAIAMLAVGSLVGNAPALSAATGAATGAATSPSSSAASGTASSAPTAAGSKLLPAPGASASSGSAAPSGAALVGPPPRSSNGFDLEGASRELPFARPSLRPTSKPLRWCDDAVCVHGDRATDATKAALLLSDAADVLSTMRALRWPSPRFDGRLGGDSRIDVYLDDLNGWGSFLDAGSSVGSTDRGSAFVVAGHPGTSCSGRHDLARALLDASLLGQDAALEPGQRGMMSDWLASIAAPCTSAELERLDEAQRAPERTIIGAPGEPGPGGMLLPWHLEERYGDGSWGKLSFSMSAIAGQRANARRLFDEPDMFDVLRVSQDDRGSSLAETLLDVAVARAFVGTRSDETHLFDVARYGELGRVRFEWAVDHVSLPRRLAPMRPIEPLGATYLWLDLARVQLPTELTFVAEWEEPVAFRWSLVKIDERGAARARIDVVPVLGETRIQKSVRDLQGLSGIVIVGLNEGEASRDEPFDPGRVRQDAHGYLVTLYP